MCVWGGCRGAPWLPGLGAGPPLALSLGRRRRRRRHLLFLAGAQRLQSPLPAPLFSGARAALLPPSPGVQAIPAASPPPPPLSPQGPTKPGVSHSALSAWVSPPPSLLGHSHCSEGSGQAPLKRKPREMRVGSPLLLPLLFRGLQAEGALALTPPPQASGQRGEVALGPSEPSPALQPCPLCLTPHLQGSQGQQGGSQLPSHRRRQPRP